MYHFLLFSGHILLLWHIQPNPLFFREGVVYTFVGYSIYGLIRYLLEVRKRPSIHYLSNVYVDQ